MPPHTLAVHRWPLPIHGQLLPALGRALYEGGPTVAVLPSGPGQAALIAAVRPDEPVERTDIALVVPTSGSTGAPKGVLLPAPALLASARLTHERLGGPGRWLLALPPTHIAGLQVLVRSLAAGTAPEVFDLTGGFDPAAFAIATRRLGGGRRYTALVPTQLRRLLVTGAELPQVHVALRTYDAVLVGGAATPPQLVAQARVEGARVVPTYGMTETSGGCVYDGRPLDGVGVRIDGSGVIELSGPTLAAGYRCDPSATAAAFRDGWFRTADRGRHENGRLVVTGRADHAILSGGVTVDPVAVEAVLEEHPAVATAAVVGHPDPEWGEHVVALVVPAEGLAAFGVEELRRWVAERLGVGFAPRHVIVTDALPLLPTGKLDRTAIRETVRRG
jgi:o-succinylbenzoate---CoA ligase